MGYILYGAATHIVKVEDDFHEMQELKGRAEAADIAKSQVFIKAFHSPNLMLQFSSFQLLHLFPVSRHRFSRNQDTYEWHPW